MMPACDPIASGGCDVGPLVAAACSDDRYGAALSRAGNLAAPVDFARGIETPVPSGFCSAHADYEHTCVLRHMRAFRFSFLSSSIAIRKRIVKICAPPSTPFTESMDSI